MTRVENADRPSPAALASFGAPNLAYIKAVEMDGETGFGIYSAEGRLLAVTVDRDAAFLTARHNDLEPVSVH